ncbi:hypothetical protein Taro_043194 [Colocasia esculenta]|uniref:Uncharacterized protein n=1 Tax=Colocasia esculenta TaxID=4460 RepID=A0A843X110_COLES|nr:hypothetical protein [Colocasia esculenta]
MASRGRRGVPARDGEQRRDEPRREDQGEQQAPAPQGPVLPPPPPVDYGVFMQGLVQAMQTQAHTQAALQAQLEAQEGEMEQYLEEKKASQKRPAAPFQRQEKKKATFQSLQRPVASGSGQVPSQRSPNGSPAWTSPSSNASDRMTRETSSPSSSVCISSTLLLLLLLQHRALGNAVIVISATQAGAYFSPALSGSVTRLVTMLTVGLVAVWRSSKWSLLRIILSPVLVSVVIVILA